MWDTEKESWIGQDFIASDDVEYEDENGESLEVTHPFFSKDRPYLDIKLVQPDNSSHMLN